jgi:hypothetical protein
MKKFINPLLRLGTAIALLSVIYMQNKEIEELKVKASVVSESVAPLAGDVKISNEIDSLQNELFSTQNINGRYELALEHLYEINPKAGKQFDEFLNNETE